MPEEINVGTPDISSDSNVSEASTPDYDLSFGYDSTGERTVRVIKDEPVDNTSHIVGEDIQEDWNQAKSIQEPAKPVGSDQWEQRFKEVQSYSTKVSQQNAELRDRLTIANRDIQHLLTIFQGQQPGQPVAQNRQPSPEEWQDIVSSKDKFDGYLNGPFANSLLQAVATMLQEHQQTDPVRQESAYRSDLEKLVAHSEQEGVNIRALKPELLAIMTANKQMPFANAYQLAKKLATDNGKDIRLVPQSRTDAIREKAKRLNIEQNRASGQLGKQERKIRTGSRREMLSDSLDSALYEHGLL